MLIVAVTCNPEVRVTSLLVYSRYVPSKSLPTYPVLQSLSASYTTHERKCELTGERIRRQIRENMLEAMSVTSVSIGSISAHT